jgi:hypothetical protein
MIDAFLFCLGVLGLRDATVYLHTLGFHQMDLMTFVNDALQLSFDRPVGSA